MRAGHHPIGDMTGCRDAELIFRQTHELMVDHILQTVTHQLPSVMI
jgi:hypothetical protein